jgi:uncharacterized protein YdaU (DUF1376 family)
VPKPLPYFRWYPSDAQSDLKYRSLTRAERGLFHDALDFAWMNDGLPDNEGAIGRALNMTVKELKTIWPSVRDCFPKSEDGRLRNKRQEEERNYARTKSEKATDAVRTRYGRNTNELPRAYESESVYESVSESSEPKTEKAPISIARPLSGFRADESFAPLLSLMAEFWPDLIDEDIEQSWRFGWQKLDFEQKTTAIEIMRQRIEFKQDSRYVKRPPKYFETGEWKRRPRDPPMHPAATKTPKPAIDWSAVE